MAACLQVVFDMIGELFAFQLPWGIAYGAVIVGVFGAPLVVAAFKKFF